MGADVSRIRANPLNHYSAVTIQQGRVVLDADFNELVAVLDRRARAAASDILGPARVSANTTDAFRITAGAAGLQIGVGRMYVDGLLAENHGAATAEPAKKLFDSVLGETRFADAVPYAAQPYLPEPSPLPSSGQHLVYLDVWDRELTHLERPDLVEAALGVDTSSRRQTVWQVRVLAGDAAGLTCDSRDTDLPGWPALIAPSDGRLTTGTFEMPPEDDPCELPPSGGYRGLENQTYRVEIHDGGQPGTATFKWSRENASVGSRVACMISAAELELHSVGRDDVLRFQTGDWVEITDDVRELAQRPGEMRRITVDDAARRISFTPALPADMGPTSFPDTSLPLQRNLRVLRWDQKRKVLRADANGTTTVFEDLDSAGDGVVHVPPAGTTLLLENGVTVSFSSAGANGFRTGDYWVFAARTADASVERIDQEPPRGIHHHYARLGIWDVGAGTVTDCRHQWPPAGGGQDCGCTACVSPGSHASGQFTIQDAVNAVREKGGTVCLESGEYALEQPVRIIGARSVRIRGQGPGTVVAGAGGVFAIVRSTAVAIENLATLSLGRESAISVTTVAGLTLQQLGMSVIDRTGDARGAAISLQGVVLSVVIRDNAIDAPAGIVANDPAALPSGSDAVAGFLLAAALAIDHNRLSCARQAIALTGNVQLVLGNRVRGNHIRGCRDSGVTVLGMGAPGASMTIAGNHLAVGGNGIRCTAGDLWIDDNTVICENPTADLAGSSAGIAVLTGRDKSGIECCRIAGNAVSGFTAAGIAVATPARELLIAQNVVRDCGSGIVTTGDMKTGAATVVNNHVRDVGSRGGTQPATVAGISVSRAATATIAGNSIRSIGVAGVQTEMCAGVMMSAVARGRVGGNEVTGVAPPGDFIGVAAGIVVRPPFSDFEVTHNQVHRDASASSQASNGSWFALLASGHDPTKPVWGLGDLVTVRLDAARLLVFDPDGVSVSPVTDVGSGAAPAPPPGPRGSVVANVLTARGTAPAASVAVAGECLFNDNRVESAGARQAVLLTTAVAIVHANRVRSGDVSIEIAGSASAVLGNVTTGTIVVPGGLQPPWDALNVRG